jgi:hypothetical protein
MEPMVLPLKVEGVSYSCEFSVVGCPLECRSKKRHIKIRALSYSIHGDKEEIIDFSYEYCNFI